MTDDEKVRGITRYEQVKAMTYDKLDAPMPTSDREVVIMEVALAPDEMIIGRTADGRYFSAPQVLLRHDVLPRTLADTQEGLDLSFLRKRICCYLT